MKYKDNEHYDVPHIVVERITRVTFVDVQRNKETKKIEGKSTWYTSKSPHQKQHT